MIVERMRYELLKRYGESEEMNGESEARNNGRLNELQSAFECLAFYNAWSRYNKDGERDTMASYALDVIESAYDLSIVQAKFIVDLVTQCPREFRVSHMTEFSRNMFNDIISSLEEKGLTEYEVIGSDVCCVVSHSLMRTLAFGLDWKVDNLEEQVPVCDFLELDGNDES